MASCLEATLQMEMERSPLSAATGAGNDVDAGAESKLVPVNDAAPAPVTFTPSTDVRLLLLRKPPLLTRMLLW